MIMHSEFEALENVHLGKIIGYMKIPENFTSDAQDRFLAGRFAYEESILGSTIQFRLDMSSNFI
jgi:hypothetical protein